MPGTKRPRPNPRNLRAPASTAATPAVAPRNTRVDSKRNRRVDGRTKKARVSRQASDKRATQAAVSVPVAELLERIPAMAVTKLHAVVEQARGEEYVPVQHALLEACLRRIIQKPPRLEQVRVLRRLIFGKGDTLLVARTGWGKSVIFHAFSILTRLITLQIIPLSKLGDEQLEDIRRFEGTKPCLINADHKREQKRLLELVSSHIELLL